MFKRNKYKQLKNAYNVHENYFVSYAVRNCNCEYNKK